MARALRDPNFGMTQLGLSAQDARDGLRRLFDEFETATAGQEIVGRGVVSSRRGPDVWRVGADRTERTLNMQLGAGGEQGMFTAMKRATARTLVEAIRAEGPGLLDLVVTGLFARSHQGWALAGEGRHPPGRLTPNTGDRR